MGIEMQFLHSEYDIGPQNTIEVTLDRQANVMLLDDINFQRYRSGGRFTYYGGLAEQSPVLLNPPHHGHWHLTIDLGGGGGTVRHSVRVL
jgi:hypothetical protein